MQITNQLFQMHGSGYTMKTQKPRITAEVAIVNLVTNSQTHSWEAFSSQLLLKVTEVINVWLRTNTKDSSYESRILSH